MATLEQKGRRPAKEASSTRGHQAMKRHLQIIVLAALFGVTASDVLAQQRPAPQSRASTVAAEWRAPLPRTELLGKYKVGELYAVEFLNHNIGWAVGGHSGTLSTMLFRTVDGGKTWERQTPFDGEGASLTDIGFADANNGWIVGSGHILRTTDGGESWAPVDVEPKVHDLSATKVLVLGPDAIIVGMGASTSRDIQIMRTVDGGRAWDLVAITGGVDRDRADATVTGLALAEPSTIFATTDDKYGTGGVIYRSDDGGHSWTSVAEADKPLMGIAFRGKRGVAVGVGIAFWTEDGGDTWRRVAIAGKRYAVDFIDDNAVVAVGTGPSVVISRNGGKTWQTAPGPVESGLLVDVEGVDPGWWFVAGGYGANALYHFVDPNHTEPIASGTVPLPVDVQIPGGRALPRGLYDVTLGHRGDQHVVTLGRKGEVPAAGQAAAGSGAAEQQEASAGLDAAVAKQKGQKPPACAQPCQVTLPADVTYEKENVAEGTGGRDPKAFFFRILLEPTPTGVAVVVRTAVTPPRNVALALTAVGAPQNSEGEARPVAKEAAAKGGGLFGRIKKAAAGDVRGAVAGAVNPQATQQRLRAAKAAPPAVYKVTLRQTLDLFGGTR